MFDRGRPRLQRPAPILAVVRLAPGIRTIDLGDERPAIAVQNGAGDREEQRALGLAHQLAAQQIGAARLVAPRAPRAVVQQMLQLLVRFVAIAHRMLVEDDEIGAQAFQPPVFLRLEHAPREPHRIVFGDADDRDGEIRRDAVGPQRLAAKRVLRPHIRPGAQRSVNVEHARRQPLVQLRVVARDVEMMQCALPLRRRERERAGGRAWFAILRRQRQRGLLVRRDARGERQARESARGQPDALPQAEDRIECGADRVGQRSSVERLWVVRPAPAPEERKAIGFALERAVRAAVETQHVHRPDFFAVEAAGTPVAEQR